MTTTKPRTATLAALAAAVALPAALTLAPAPAAAQKQVVVSVIYGPARPQAKVWFRIERGGLAADVKEGPYGETWRPIDNVESCGLVEHRGRWVS